MIAFNDLQHIFARSWGADSSSDPQRWRPSNPAWGQCAVTSCIVQDLFGGDIVWCEAQLPNGEKISHYFNRIQGLDVDLTRVQFPEGTLIPEGVEKRKQFNSTREYVLSFQITLQRYNVLKSRVDSCIALLQQEHDQLNIGVR